MPPPERPLSKVRCQNLLRCKLQGCAGLSLSLQASLHCMAAPSKGRAAGSSRRLSDSIGIEHSCKSSCMMRATAAAHLANLVEGEELVAGGDVQAVTSLGLLQGLRCIHVSVGLYLLHAAQSMSTLQLHCLSSYTPASCNIHEHSFLQSPCMHAGCASTYTTECVCPFLLSVAWAEKLLCRGGAACGCLHRWCMHSCMCPQTARMGREPGLRSPGGQRRGR